MSLDRGMIIEDVEHIYNRILLSHVKNEIIPFTAAFCSNLEIVILSEVSQIKKEKYCMTSLTCGI